MPKYTIKKKTFLTHGNSLKQSLANHEHPNEFINSLKETNNSIQEASALFMGLLENWYVELKRHKAFNQKGFTFYISVDPYDSCLVSVVSGHYDKPIYGGNYKLYKSIPSLLKAFAKGDKHRLGLQRRNKQVEKLARESNANLTYMGRKLNVPTLSLKNFLYNAVIYKLDDERDKKLVTKIKKTCKPKFDSSLFILETGAGQKDLVRS